MMPLYQVFIAILTSVYLRMRPVTIFCTYLTNEAIRSITCASKIMALYRAFLEADLPGAFPYSESQLSVRGVSAATYCCHYG